MSYRQIPSYNWLRVFEAAARLESFSRAADVLAMSPAAVSQQIKALESHLKKPLFTRGPHSVTLTDAGKAFLPTVQQSLNSIDTTAAALFGNPSQSPLSIEASLMFASSWLAPRLNDFQTQYPGIHLQISTSDESPDFSQPGKDIQVSFGNGPTFNQEGDFLFGETLFPVARPEIAKKIKSIKDLCRYRLIEISSHRTSWYQILTAQENLIDQAEFCFADNTVMAMSMAASGMGIALARAPASDYLCETQNLSRCLKDFSLSSPQEYYLVYPSLNGLNKQANQFRDWLLKQCSREKNER